jgi:hypothetical protein
MDHRRSYIAISRRIFARCPRMCPMADRAGPGRSRLMPKAPKAKSAPLMLSATRCIQEGSSGSMQPNSSTVLQSLAECQTAGEEAFLEKYASGVAPRAHYVLYEGAQFPLKAIWAAAHRPPVHTREFRTGDARRGLESMGITACPRKIQTETLVARLPCCAPGKTIQPSEFTPDYGLDVRWQNIGHQ